MFVDAGDADIVAAIAAQELTPSNALSLAAGVTWSMPIGGTSVRRIHYELLPLMQALFTETNPIGIKTALALAKKIPNAELRMPLTPMTEGNPARLAKVVEALGSLA